MAQVSLGGWLEGEEGGIGWMDCEIESLFISRASLIMPSLPHLSHQSVAAAMAPGLAGAALPGPPTLPGGFAPTPAPAPAPAPAVATPSLVPTTFLCVQGMVTSDVLKDDDEYKEVRSPKLKCVLYYDL